jgi:integrase
MSNISFRPNKGLKVKNYTLPQKVYFRYRLGRKIDFNASIGFDVLLSSDETKSNWDFKNQRVKNRSSILNKEDVNGRISQYLTHFKTFDENNRINKVIPSYEDVKAHFKSLLVDKSTVEVTPINTLLKFVDYFIKQAESKQVVTLGTIKNYKLTSNILNTFNKEKYLIDFGNINLDFYADFVEWCESKNLSKNYIGKHIKTLKTFMNHAVEKGLTDNLQFKSPRFVVISEDADNIYLNEKELFKLWQLNLSKNKRLENVRDLFLIGCYTGLRVSDYNNLSKDYIKEIQGVKILKVKTKKTNKIVDIPLHPIVENIINKYNGNPPPYVPDQKINIHIKEIAESAGIDEVVFTTQTRGGKKVTVKNYKFDLIKTHTARRSFCTNAYLSEMLPMDIMTISGHSTEKAFLNYIKATTEQVALKMSTNKFFNPTLKAI